MNPDASLLRELVAAALGGVSGEPAWARFDLAGLRLMRTRSHEVDEARRTLMAYAFAVRIPPGKTEAVRRLTAESLGA